VVINSRLVFFLLSYAEKLIMNVNLKGMKNLLKQLFIFSLFIFFSAEKMEAQFSISGEFRPRLEYRDGYQKIGDSTMKPYTDILGRTRISFDYKSEKIASCFSLQHAFVFGENNFSADTITKNTVNIFEGWFRYNFTKSFAFRVGRVVLSYDDQRVLGSSSWRQWGQTHDAVTLFWEVAGINYKGDFGFAINNMSPATSYLSSYNMKNYKYMGYLWEQKKFFNDKLKVSLMAIVDVNQKNSTYSTKTTLETLYVVNGQDTIGTTVIKNTSKVYEYYPEVLYARATVGANVWYTWKNLMVNASGFLQAGHYKDGRKLSAWMYSVNAAYQFVRFFKFQLGFDHLSGNNLSDTSEYKTTVHGFSTLWGTNHTFYGYMDMYATYLGQDALEEGLNDLWARATFSFSEKTSIEATYRWFTMPNGYLPFTPTKKIPLPYQAVNKNLGSEVDLMFLYKILPNMELNAAYCLYFKTPTREILDNIANGTGRLGQYGYLMITYKPNFFTSEKK
jgi:hypothetical protein